MVEDREEWWRLDNNLSMLYDNCVTFSYSFRQDTLPDRCVNGYEYLCDEFLAYMSTIRQRVHTNKIRFVVKATVKNISRTKHHKTNGIKYVGDKMFWVNDITNPDRLSYNIFIEFIDWLVDCNYVTKYAGSGGAGFINTTNLLVISENLLNICIGGDSIINKQPLQMEDCLLSKKRGNIIIHTKVKKTQVPREILPEERDEVENLDDVLEAYNNSLENSTLSINGHDIPELHFRRIFNDSLNGGGRYYDQGEFLSKSKEERATTLIDGRSTVSLDFKHLHPSLCYELKGLELGDKDPYNVPVVFKQNNTVMNAWMEECNKTVTPNTSRSLAKTALLCMINAKTKKSCMSAISNEIKNDKNKRDQSKRKFVGVYDVEVKTLVDSLLEHNKEISEYIYSGHGIVMQNLDSKMIDYCISVFLGEGQVLIPVHDCIVVREDLKGSGLDAMEDAYEFVMKTKLNCKIEEE